MLLILTALFVFQSAAGSNPCFFHSQERLAVPALWPWHPKMPCPLPWPSQSQLMPTSKELIPLSESHVTTQRPQLYFLYLQCHCGVSQSSLQQGDSSTPLVLHACNVLHESGTVLSEGITCMSRFRVRFHIREKHTVFYWLTAAKLLLCKKAYFCRRLANGIFFI